jgi:hypothetical protein
MESLNQLIERLQHLHLEQARILQALENIVAADNATDIVEHVEPNTTQVAVPVSTVPVTVPVPTVLAPVRDTVFHIGQ